MKSLFKIFTIFNKKDLHYCVFIGVAMAIGAMLEAIGIGAILPLISIMGQPDFLARHPQVAEIAALVGVTEHVPFIILCAFCLMGLYLLKNIYLGWQLHLQIFFATRKQKYYSEQLLAGYLAKPYLFHLDHNTATLLRNVNSGPQMIFNVILFQTLQLFTEIVTAITIWAMLVVVDPFTAIIVAGFLAAILFAILKAFRRRISELGSIQNIYSAEQYKWINQALGAVKETKVSCREAAFLTEYSRAAEKYSESLGNFTYTNQLPRLFIETVVVSGLLLLIIGKLAMGYDAAGIVPLLGVLALAAFRLMPSANRIINMSNAIKFQMPFFEEIYGDFLEIKNKQIFGMDQEQFPVPDKPLAFNTELKIEGLGFHYPEVQDEVLTDISFTVPKGKFVGIIGPSGAGKTTFVDILLGLLEPQKGQILCDSQDVYSDIRAWQANLAYVPQDIYLIDGTVRDNIALGMLQEEIDDKQIEKVLHMAELYDFVQILPKGLDTFVGERGVKLSGGQRQRIGIARALYREPNILILDEATSALDNDTEKSITDTILKLKGQITIIAIAHRVSTLEQCDFKVKFEDGRAEVVSNV